MKKLPNSKHLIYSDTNYTHAVNYEHKYNAPVTLNYGEKHNRTKYIIASGNQDIIDIYQDGIFLYVVSQNNGLSYIGMEIIDTERKEIIDSVFLSEEDTCSGYGNVSDGILDINDTEEQIKILMQYCNF